MRNKLILSAVALGLVGAGTPAMADVQWASYAIASSQYSTGQLAAAADPFVGPALCLALSQTVCPPNPDDIAPAIENGVDGTINGSWSAMQATGEPDTDTCGDQGTAWAPLSSGTEPQLLGLDPVAEPETLVVFYDPPVEGATQVDIHETNIGGFVDAVEVLVAGEPPILVFSGEDTTGCPGVLSIPFTTDLPVIGVAIHTSAVGWEEIDAVGVHH